MRVAVPDGLAEALINAGLAKPVKAKYRSAIVEWIIEAPMSVPRWLLCSELQWS